jgi:putative salt-induced outer membrane protein YdiY
VGPRGPPRLHPDTRRLRAIHLQPTARGVLLAHAAAFLVGASPLLAQKTDKLVLKRGDEITGEVKELDRGKLSYKTDDMGTLSVEWDKVAHLTSENYFEVENRYGLRRFGRLAATEAPGELLVILTDTARVRMTDIVSIARIRASFWSRLDGYVDIGFDFQKANQNRQLNGSAEARYRGEKWAGKVNGSTYFQRQEGAEQTSRNDISLQAQRLFGNHWSAIVFGSLEQNRQLGLDLRQTIGAGATREFIHTNRMTFYAVASLAYANEAYTDEEGTTNTVQTPLGADFAFFLFDSPKTDITSDLTVTPILSDLGRWRIDFNARISYELISDFTIGFSFFDNFDSRPPSATASTNDYGLTFSLGYSF